MKWHTRRTRTEPQMRPSSLPTDHQRPLSAGQPAFSQPMSPRRCQMPTSSQHQATPVPMDIDLAWRKAIPSALCFHCGQPGHFSKNCLDHLDVWNRSTDELQELLEDRLAKLDVAAPDSGPVVPADKESVTDGFSQKRQVKSTPSSSV